MKPLLSLLFFFFFCVNLTAQDNILPFTILHTNDEHSILRPIPLVDYHTERDNPTLGGFARLATAVREIREQKAEIDEPILLFSGGDIMGGSPFAWLILNDEAPEIKLMQYLGYDAMVVGNHEFDYGPETLASYLKLAGYPENHERMAVISSNIEIPIGHSLNDAEILRTKIFELNNGLRVGVFGLLGKEATDVAPLAAPIKFTDQHETARKYVVELRDQNVDVIVAITHSGTIEDRALAQSVPGIDVIVGGHDHVALYQPIIENNTIIVQSGYYLRNLGMLELAYDTNEQKVIVLNDENDTPFLTPLDFSVPEDSTTAEMIASYSAKLNSFLSEFTDGFFDDYASVIGFSEFSLNHSPAFRETAAGNITTDAMRLITEKVTGKRVDFAFQGNGVIRADVIPGTMPWSEGALTFMDIATSAGLGTGPDLQPGYPIVSVYLTGEEIHRVLEISALLSQYLGDIYFLQVSGLRFEVDLERSILFRIPFVGTPIPTYSAVFGAELFMGDGIQNEDGPWQKLEKDNTLYHVVSDYYVASFLPMIGDLLPNLQLILKDENGNPLESIDDAVVQRDGRELKVWQTLTEYIATLPEVNGSPTIPNDYQQVGDRIIITKGFPLIVWPILILIAIISLLIFGISKWRKRRN